MHDLIDDIKSALDNIQYKAPDGAWEQFKVQEKTKLYLPPTRRITRRSFAPALTSAAVFFIVFFLNTIPREIAFPVKPSKDVSVCIRAPRYSISNIKNKKLKSNFGIENTNLTAGTLPDHAKIKTADSLNEPKVSTDTEFIITLASRHLEKPPYHLLKLNSSQKPKLNKWVLAEIMRTKGKGQQFELRIANDFGLRYLYSFEKTNGKQSYSIKTKFEGNPLQSGSSVFNAQTEIRQPDDNSTVLNTSNAKMLNIATSTMEEQNQNTEIGLRKSDRLNQDTYNAESPIRPNLPTNSFEPSNRVETENLRKLESGKNPNIPTVIRSSTKTKQLQYLEYYNLSIGFKQELGKKNSIKVEPYLRIPVSVLYNSKDLRYNQYGLKLNIGF